MVCALYCLFRLEFGLVLNVYFFFFILCLEIEIKSDATLADAVKILAGHNVFSAPVVDVEAPEDASWIDRYIGIVEFAGIVVWILHQVRHISYVLHINSTFSYQFLSQPLNKQISISLTNN